MRVPPRLARQGWYEYYKFQMVSTPRSSEKDLPASGGYQPASSPDAAPLREIASALAHHFYASKLDLESWDEKTVLVSQTDIAKNRLEQQATEWCRVDPVLHLTGLTGKPFKTPTDDCAEVPASQSATI